MPEYAAAAYSPSRRAWVYRIAKNQVEAIEFTRDFLADDQREGASITIIVTGEEDDEQAKTPASEAVN